MHFSRTGKVLDMKALEFFLTKDLNKREQESRTSKPIDIHCTLTVCCKS